MRGALLQFVGAVVLLSSSVVSAATYYVDPNSSACNDANPGTASSAPWCTPPGTRLTTNPGFLRASWGTIDGSPRIACGDTIFLKGGSTHNIGKGGAWRIDPTFYTNNCVAGSPITITIATDTEWPGSSGHFTFDGTGITTTSTAQGNGGCPSGGFCALVDIENINTVIFGGRSAAQRIIIQNITVDNVGDEDGVLIRGPNYGPHIERIEARWLLIRNRNLPAGQGGGLDMGSVTNAWIHDIEVEDWRGPGYNIGITPPFGLQTQGIGLERVTSRRNGPTTAGVNAPSDCFQLQSAWNASAPGGGGLWCLSCYCLDHYWNGSDSGGSNMAGYESVFRFRDMRILGAGRTVAEASIRSGFESAGDDNCSGAEGTVLVTHSFLYGNYNTGFDGPHGGGVGIYMNNTLFRAGQNNATITYDRSSCNMTFMNNIVRGDVAPWLADQASFSQDAKPVSNFNLYDYWTNANDWFSSFRFSGNSFSATNTLFSNAASQSGFTGANDKISNGTTRQDPRFNSLGGNCDRGWDSGRAEANFATCDLRLQAGSPAIDAATYFMRANGAGSNASTITVKGNGQVGAHSSDPRLYFRAPETYWRSPGDTIQIANATCTPAGNPTIVTMTSTSIILDRSCTWSDNAGIHLPWTGTAPDMGALESGQSSGAPAAPTLISVEPLP